MIWILFAIVTASVVLAVARPLGRAAAPASGGASEIEAYKLQLADLDREQELGEIGQEEAAQTRTEISRRLLKASRQGATAVSAGPSAAYSKNVAFFALAGVIAIGTVGLYAIYGNPSLPDQPLDARITAPPSQQPMAIRIANLERRLRSNQNDPAGWAEIAPQYFASGQFDKAAQAYRKAIKLGGQDEDKLLGLFEALTFGNEGTVPAEAKPVLDTALAKNPKSLRGRFWLAIHAIQAENKSEAERIYREMLSENPSADWKGLIFKQLAALKEDSGAQAPANPRPSAKTPAMSKAPAMSRAPKNSTASADNQAPPIDTLVERLAARLKQNGADLEGWVMLIRSYSMLKQPAKMQEAAELARKQFASDPEALKKIGAAVSMGEQQEAEASAKAPDEAPAGDQSVMIRGMVERLAARLKENGADLDGWLRLIRSYTVLKETAKAQEAAASARQHFSSDPKALEQIDGLMRELGVVPAETKPAAPGDAAQGKQVPSVDDMVGRLAARLKQNPADLDGWLMLIRSYSFLKEPGKAEEAAASARQQFSSDPKALEQIGVLLPQAGGTPAEADAKPSDNAPASGQDAMIRGMVERLATRLKENAADLDGWLRLIRSYTVLNETAKAQEAAASARKQFESEPQALERIEALARELGIPAADGKGE